MLYVILIIIVGLFIYTKVKKGPSASLLGGSTTPVVEVLSNWRQLFPFFSLSAEQFYSTIEEMVKKHQMPDIKIERVQQKEKGLFSSSREYLRVRRGYLIFEICAAPFGTDFFVSWWLYETEGTAGQLLKNTKLGDWLSNRKHSKTFFQMDTESMFRSCVHECVLEALETVTAGKGVRQLNDSEKAFTMTGK